LADSIATVVNWYGPYTGSENHAVLTAARREAANEWGKGLYAAVGRRSADPDESEEILYMGVGKQLSARLNSRHHKLAGLNLTAIWLGEIGVPGIPGRKRKKIDTHLDVAEWASVFFLELPHNRKKRYKEPYTSCVIVNRWWGTDFQTIHPRPISSWADIIEFDVDKGIGNLVWFPPKKRIKTININDVLRPSPGEQPAVDEE
jgi:hypothetical protein